ncbi:MAG: NAD(P)-binding protein [Polyangiaceae bacterium]|nr:NAD(P)-binding protein [Polyangiaceae bacterium]
MFVERGGELVLPGPFLHEKTQFRSFWFKAELERLRRLCERDFNEPSGGAVRVSPLFDQVALALARIDNVFSLSPLATKSAAKEHDFALWIPVQVETERERFVAFYLPYVFVDQPFAMATGREVYGFPKTLAHFSYPPNPQKPGVHTVSTWHIPHPGADLALAPLFTIAPTGEFSSPAGWASILSHTGELMGIREAFAPGFALNSKLAQSVLGAEVKLLFLHQVRDAEQPTRALLQQVLVASCKVRALHDVKPLVHQYRVQVHPSSSHPLAKEIGLSGGSALTTASVLVEFDFEVGHGRSLWRGGMLGTPKVNERVGSPVRPKRKIAVLGGGLGALSAVAALTDTAQKAGELEVTVFEATGHLGGKGASVRNPEARGRIEEHGLHLWFGFYDHAFELMRTVYKENNRPPGSPLRTLEDAFLPHDRIMFYHSTHVRSPSWVLDFPRRDAEVGKPAKTPAQLVEHLAFLFRSGSKILLSDPDGFHVSPAVKKALFLFATLSTLLVDQGFRGAGKYLPLVARVRGLLRNTVEKAAEGQADRQRIVFFIDLALTCLTGILADNLVEKGFDSINHLDLREWLARHGASDNVLQSPQLKIVYDMTFSYKDGDRNKPSIAAGAGLLMTLRMAFDYKGSFQWKMNGGWVRWYFHPFMKC